MKLTIKIILLLLLSIGLYGGLSVSYLTITEVARCPSVFSIPACFIVAIGYFLMFFAAVAHKQSNIKWAFILGWLPVFLLALVGSILEVSNGNTCPQSNMGIPLCYISLGLVVMVAMLYWLLNKIENRKKYA